LATKEFFFLLWSLNLWMLKPYFAFSLQVVDLICTLIMEKCIGFALENLQGETEMVFLVHWLRMMLAWCSVCIGGGIQTNDMLPGLEEEGLRQLYPKGPNVGMPFCFLLCAVAFQCIQASHSIVCTN
jgi:hypothetical protein